MKRSRVPRSAFARAAVLLAATVFASCLDDSAGPSIPHAGYFAVMPAYRSGLAGIVPLAEARITLERIEDGALVVDSVVPIQPGDTAVDLSASVVMVSAAQEFTLNIYLITPAGDTAYRGGPVTVTPSSDAVDPTPVPVDLVYVGVGSEAAGVRILSEGEHLFSGDSVLLLAEAFDSGGSPIPGTPIGWASLDPLTASIPDDTEGWVVGGQRGTARITATLPTGSSDTTSVAVQPVPSQVVVVSGSGQSAEVGTTLPNPIVLEVQGADGLPVTGVSVRLVAAAGSTSPDSLGVDGSGRLSFTWTLGVTAGTQSVTATVVEYPAVQATVTATADAKPATDLAIVSGNDQTGPVATALSDSLVVLATDIDGQPVANTTITWFVTLNDGTVSPTTSVTDANGLAATEWTLGSLAGANEVFAGLPGITPPSSPDSVGLAPQAEGVTFAATGEPGPAAVLELVSGDAQSDTVGATLPLPIVVRVTDLFGNPVQDVTVDFTTADGGTLVPASTTTDVDGLAQSVWTLGLEAGTQSATATSTGLAGSPVTFSATATSTIAPPGINVWTATSGTWSTDANWSLGRAPVEGDTVEITQGGDYVVALDQNATIAKLTLGGTGSSIALQVSGNTLTITDTGVEPGLLIFPSGNLEIATATVTAERVRNEGQIEGTGSGANLLASAITNIGLMQVLSGDFTVTHGASYDLQSSGGLRVESGASFTIGPNGALTYLAGQLSGLGTLHFESGTEMSLNADLAYDSLTIQMVDGFIQPIATERLTVGPDATLILSQQSGVMTSNAIVVNQGTMTVAEGPVAQNDSLYVATGGLLQIQPYSSSSLTVQRGLDNAGTIELGSATPVVSSLSLTVAQGSLTNRASGTIITLPYDQARYLTAQLVNDGTITLQGSLYFSTPEAQHVNRGLINVVGGTLEIGLNGTNPTFANEGTFHLSGGDVTVSMNNDNARLVSSGTLLIDAGRAMRCFDDLTSGTMDVTAGSLGLDGTLLAPDTLFVQAGAVVQGSGVIDGSAVVGGDLSGDVLPGNVDQAGTLTFVGDLPQTATSTFYMELGGTGAGESDLIEITGTATIGGTIDASTILPTYTPAAGDTIPIIIAGEGSGEPVLVLPADPPGLTVSVYSVDATAPTPDTAYVVFTGVALPGVSWTGAGDGSSWSDPDNWNKGGSPAVPGVGDSVFIALDGATVTLNAVAQVAALEVTGTVAELTHTGGTLTIDSSMTIGPNATYALVGGTLAGTGGVDVQGTMAWASGSLQISGTTAIASGAVLTMSGATKSLYNGTISNAGWLVWNGGTLYSYNDGSFSNLAEGTMELQGVLTFSRQNGAGTFTNAGTLTKTGTGTATIAIPITNTSTGTLDIQAGTVDINTTGSLEAGGTLKGVGNMDVTGAGAGGNLAGNINPGDQVAGYAGILTWTGTFDPDPGAILNIDLGGATAGTQHDLFSVTGSVQHDGTLNVTLRDGFTPTEGSRFPIMAFNDAVFGFATLNFPTVSGIVFDTLTVVNVSVPDTLYVTASGAAPQPIAFAGDSAGGLSSGIFSVLPDGSGQTRLLNFIANGSHHPRWAPDNSKIVFNYVPFGPAALNALAAVSADGTDSATVASDTSMWRPRYSRNGTHLAAECGNGGYPGSAQDVCVIGNVPATVSAMRNVGNGVGKTYVTDAISTNLGGPGAFAWNPLNDNQLAVVRDTQAFVGGPNTAQIWLVNYDGSGRTALTAPIDLGTNEFVTIYSMDWAPDGSFIAFEAVNQSTSERAIFRVELSDGTVTQLTSPGNGFPSDFRPVVSPGSDRILFAREVDGWVLIHIPSTGATEPLGWNTSVFNFSLSQGGWDWSPDGTEIVHTSSYFAGGGVSIGKILSTTTQATYTDDLVLVGRNAPLGAVQDRQPSWRP